MPTIPRGRAATALDEAFYLYLVVLVFGVAADLIPLST
jgi:hypothetical protein